MTERAYDNPKFVEDPGKDIACALAVDPRVQWPLWWKAKLESIHCQRLRFRHRRGRPMPRAVTLSRQNLPGLPTPVQLAAQMGERLAAGEAIAASAAGEG